MCNFGAGYWMPGLDFFLSKTMAKIRINRALLEDLAKRVYGNENGVKVFLEKAGITIDAGKGVTIDDLKHLRELNEEAFNDMIVFLYPELFNQHANGDGKSGSAGAGAGGSISTPLPEGTTGTTGSTSGSGLSNEDKSNMFKLFGDLVNTSGDVLKGIFGNSTGNGASAAYAQLSKDMKIILVVAGIFALIITGVLIYTINRKK